MNKKLKNKSNRNIEVNQTLIQQYSSSIVRNLDELSGSISKMKHGLTKGEIRELFVSNVLKLFLTNQFGIGSGIVINQTGQQSSQTDIIIYDNRVLPPFIREQNIGVFPIESVIATIEVKSNLKMKDIQKAENDAKRLRNEIWIKTQYLQYLKKLKKNDKEKWNINPICLVFGFKGNGPRIFSKKNAGNTKNWLSQNIKNLLGICVLKKFSWMNVTKRRWGGSYFDDLRTYEETKRFIAVTLDNIRTISQQRLLLCSYQHMDWLTAYIRDKKGSPIHGRDQIDT